jgi:flagellar protein FlgJ
MDASGLSTQIAADAKALAALKVQASQDPKAGLKGAARQFETLFLQMVLKSMRDATPQEGMLDSDQSRLYQELLDQQLAQTLAARGATGLAGLIERQLAPGAAAASTGSGPVPGPQSRFGLETLRGAARQLLGEPASAQTATTGEAAADGAGPTRAQREFVSRVWPHAAEAAKATGIPAQFIVAQAALETGWGRAEIRTPDGRPSHNLFNIKAGRGWTGEVAEVATTEYAGGAVQRQVERFRAYRSYAEAFADYANLLGASPRYAGVIGQQDGEAFARALQQSGYATDPMYAQKLLRVIGSATLKQAAAG